MSIAILMASIPSHAAVISPSVMLNLEQIFSIIIISFRIPESSLLYDYWFSGCPRVVLLAVIIGWDIFPPSIMRSAVTHFFKGSVSPHD